MAPHLLTTPHTVCVRATVTPLTPPSMKLRNVPSLEVLYQASMARHSQGRAATALRTTIYGRPHRAAIEALLSVVPCLPATSVTLRAASTSLGRWLTASPPKVLTLQQLAMLPTEDLHQALERWS